MMIKLKPEIEADAVEYKGNIYFIPSYMNALFSLNLHTRETRLIKILGVSYKANNYRNAFRYKEHAWFIPWETDKILYVNLKTLLIKYFDIPYQRINRYGLNTYPYTYYFSSLKIDEKYVFLTPTGTDTAVLIDMENQAIKTFDGIIDVKTEILWGSAVFGNCVYMSPCKGNRMISLNFKTGEIKEYPWQYQPMQYSGMCINGNKLYFAPNKADNLLSFDLDSERYEEIPLGDFYKKSASYLELFSFKDSIWLLPWWSRYILIYSLNDKSWSCIRKDDEICTSYDTELRIIDYEIDPIFVTCRTGYVSIYHKDTGLFENLPVRIDVEDIRKYVADNIDLINTYFSPHMYMDFEQYIGLGNYITICNKFY